MPDEEDALGPWREIIASGKPAMQFVVGLPIRITLGPDGVVFLDSPTWISGIEEAAIQRIVVAVPVSNLKAALDYLEKNPGSFVELKTGQSAH